MSLSFHFHRHQKCLPINAGQALSAAKHELINQIAAELLPPIIEPGEPHKQIVKGRSPRCPIDAKVMSSCIVVSVR